MCFYYIVAKGVTDYTFYSIHESSKRCYTTELAYMEIKVIQEGN